MVHEKIKHRFNPVLANKKPWIQMNKFGTIVSEVSSFVGNTTESHMKIQRQSLKRSYAYLK